MGLFRGLKIKLGGAFAAYMLLLLAMWYVAPEPSYTELWELQGAVRLQNDTTAAARRKWTEGVRFSLSPPHQQVTPLGSFYVRFPYRAESDVMPSLLISVGTCAPTRVYLRGQKSTDDPLWNDFRLAYAPKKRTIKATVPIVLEDRVQDKDGSFVPCW